MVQIIILCMSLIFQVQSTERIEVGFDPTMYLVTDGGTATLTVVLNMAYTEDITVSLQTNPGSAGGNIITI